MAVTIRPTVPTPTTISEPIFQGRTPMADFLGMMKQAAQLQSKMQAMQDELANVEVEGISGGGLVAVRMTAKMDVKGVKIDPSLMKVEEREVLEDLLVTALSDARRKAETAMQEKMQSLTGGLGLPPGLFGQ
jgi:nucleoid-associated protein EbfC